MEYAEALTRSPLFNGIDATELKAILRCLGTKVKAYEAGRHILWEGDTIHNVGVLLSGRARSTKTGIDGRLVIVTLLAPGSTIGLLLAASKHRKSPVSVEMLEDGEALFLPMQNILTYSDCPHHALLLENLLGEIAEKALILHDRNDCLIQPSIREKALAFLTGEARSANSREFTLSMGRNAMAEYLNVDRSALSRELSWMKRDGLIEYKKNWFLLNQR